MVHGIGMDELFTAAELDYLAAQLLGRLATVAPDGTPQVSPVGFQYNRETGTIDVGGFAMSTSRKYRNVAANGHAAIVVDDLASTDPWRVRCLEIRGSAETVQDPDPQPGQDKSIIRLRPRRIISFGIDGPDRDPHEMVANNRTVDAIG